jgi:hypothetical protein
MVRLTAVLWIGIDMRVQVPVIAVFTKYDQFRRNIKMKLEDQNRDPALLDAEAESIFSQHYLARLGSLPPFIGLESEVSDNYRGTYCTESPLAGMHKPGQKCNDLVEMTASALSGGVVALMLLAVQRDNLELSISHAVKR